MYSDQAYSKGLIDLPFCFSFDEAFLNSGNLKLSLVHFLFTVQMENIQQNLSALNESLRSLNLQSAKEAGDIDSEKVLVGKVLATRVYRRFTVAEIVIKIWRLRCLVRVDKLKENIVKFQFRSKEDRDHIYKIRPWSLNGANLILKVWSNDKILREISFNTTTLWLQIHELPPSIMHEGATEKIGSRVSTLHQETVNRKSVVAHRFLRVRMDISVKNSIPADYFYERADGDELWVQFKYERLPDFCFHCGFLDHVTGKCSFSNLATITSAHGVTAKVYGPWLKAEVAESLDFVNISVNEGKQRWKIQNNKKLELVVFGHGNSSPYEGRHGKSQANQGRSDPLEENQLACEMSYELEALNTTLNRQVLRGMEEVNVTLLHQIRISNNNPQLLAKWATEALNNITLFNVRRREELAG